MDYKTQTLSELESKSHTLTSKKALVGFDGFVDIIVKPVDERTGQGSHFTPIKSLRDFGQRIVDAAGKSTNIELYPTMEKLGGNGPILANSLISAGLETQIIGSLGYPVVNPVFSDLAKRANVVSISEPGITHAVECEDGKVMFGQVSSLDEITYKRIIEVMGEGAFLDAVSRADLFAIVNWTMIPNMTVILNNILDRVLPNYGPREGRTFFFDLADPEKRSKGDLKAILVVISRFRAFGQVTLGLNLSEAQQVHAVLGFGSLNEDEKGLRKMAADIRSKLNIACVTVHPRESAACATRDDNWWIEGPYVESPKISTGAGDHFNAGFAVGQTLCLTPPACLTLAASFSGYYVRTANSPSLFDIDTFIRTWN